MSILTGSAAPGVKIKNGFRGWNPLSHWVETLASKRSEQNGGTAERERPPRLWEREPPTSRTSLAPSENPQIPRLRPGSCCRFEGGWVAGLGWVGLGWVGLGGQLQRENGACQRNVILNWFELLPNLLPSSGQKNEPDMFASQCFFPQSN